MTEVLDDRRVLAEVVFPAALWQRCVVHWYRNAFTHVPRTKMAEIALMLKAIHASESRAAAEATAERARASLIFRCRVDLPRLHPKPLS
jgi:transposase-like protein